MIRLRKMKRYKIKMNLIHQLMIISLMILGMGCTNNFEEVNTNPRVLTEDFLRANPSSLELAFGQAQYFSVNGLHWRFQIAQNLFSDLWCQYYATTAVNFDSDRYTQVGRWADLAWGSFYGQAAPQIKLVEDLTAEAGEDVLNAVSKIWRVHAYHRMIDYWGPVPYTDFGNLSLEVPYTTEEAAYTDFFNTLDEAVTVLKANSGAKAFPGGDRIYGGDTDKWLKFANSLRLRLAMRIRFAEEILAKTEAEKAVLDGVIESNEDNAFVATDANNLNPLATITNWGEFRMSATMESILKGYDDPRTPVFFSPAKAGDSDADADDSPYEGLLNGQIKEDLEKKVMDKSQNDIHSDVGPAFLPLNKGGTNPPIGVLRASEVAFLRAEGALEGWNMGGSSAKELYEKGIALSLEEWDVSKADYSGSAAVPAPYETDAAAVTDIPVAYEETGTEERRLEQIITQKWLALYPNGWEAWAELRRTGYPKQYARAFSANPDVSKDKIMRRMVYPASERTTNANAVNAAIGTLSGGDKNNSRLWWDAR